MLKYYGKYENIIKINDNLNKYVGNFINVNKMLDSDQ
jgi:hypothetical protein